MHPRNCIIGVDIGTTSVKVIAFTEDGEEIARHSARLETYHDAPDAAEQDPQAVYETVTRSLRDVSSSASALGYRVHRVGMSCAMHSLLCISQQNEPLTRAIIWMDTRSEREAQDLWDSPEGKSIYLRTGTPIHPMSPLAKLLWLRNRHQSLFDQASKFVSLKEFIWYQWFHEWQVDESIASATGLYNLQLRSWDEEAMRLVGLTTHRFSELVSTTFIRTGVLEPALLESGMSSQTVFNIGASDGVLANLGLHSTETATMVLTIGTSLAVRIGSTQVYTDAQTRPFCYVLDDHRYILGGPSNSGGVVLEWLVQQILGHSPATAVEDHLQPLIEEAEHSPATSLYCLPYVAGERAPLWNAHARAAFIGLGLQHTQSHMMRAAIEGILFNAYWIAQPLVSRFGQPQRLIASGRLVETAWVRQLAADIFGIPVEFHGHVDASVLGAVELCTQATLQAHGAIPEAIPSSRTTNPRPSQVIAVPNPEEHTHYQRKFDSFQKIARLVTSVP